MSITKGTGFITIEKEIRINLEKDSSLFYDEESKLYKRKVSIHENNESSHEDECNAVPLKSKTCNLVIKSKTDSKRKLTFSTIETDFVFSDDE